MNPGVLMGTLPSLMGGSLTVDRMWRRTLSVDRSSTANSRTHRTRARQRLRGQCAVAALILLSEATGMEEPPPSGDLGDRCIPCTLGQLGVHTFEAYLAHVRRG